MKRTTCGGCGSSDLHPFLDLGLSPIADAYTSTVDEVSKTYPLELALCVDCRLVQLLEVVDSETLFGTGYSFYSSASAPLSSYHARYADDVKGRYGHLARRLTVEIGCNDGDMLRWFQGCPHVGVDPAHGPVEVARSRGLYVLEEEFTQLTVRRIKSELGPAGLIVANHVLAHVADPGRLLRHAADLLSDEGVMFVEVQYLPDLLVNNAFDLVYHEHRNFFTLTSLETLAQRAGLRVRNAWLTPRQGGSLRVMLQSAAMKSPPLPHVYAIRKSEEWLTTGTQAYDGMQGRVERMCARLHELVVAEVARGHVVAGYGAPAKATTLLNFCEVDANTLAFVVDSTLAKQGRFIPGTGIPIVAPAPPRLSDTATAREFYGADTFLLLAWNYAGAIMHTNPGLNWILPVPAPMLL